MNWKKYIPWFIILCLTILLVTKKEVKQTITIPEKQGTFKVDEPKPIILTDTVKVDGQTKYIPVPNPVNKNLLDKYKSLKDSVSRLEQYKEAITERTYKETFQDSTQMITVESKVIGTLKSQKVDYKIFPQTIEVKTKTPKYSLFLGTFATIPTKDITAPVIGANIALKAPKMLYFIGYDTQQNITAAIAFKLF